MKVSRWIGSVVAVLFATQIGATELTIVPLTGAEQSTAIEDIGSWQFKGDSVMVLYAKADSTELATKRLSEVRKVIFTENQTNIAEAVAAASAYSVYPNPTQEKLFVRGADEHTTLQVVDMQGRAVRSAKGASVSVSDLSVGVYTLLVNGEAFRVIKK